MMARRTPHSRRACHLTTSWLQSSTHPPDSDARVLRALPPARFQRHRPVTRRLRPSRFTARQSSDPEMLPSRTPSCSQPERIDPGRPSPLGVLPAGLGAGWRAARRARAQTPRRPTEPGRGPESMSAIRLPGRLQPSRRPRRPAGPIRRLLRPSGQTPAAAAAAAAAALSVE